MLDASSAWAGVFVGLSLTAWCPLFSYKVLENVLVVLKRFEATNEDLLVAWIRLR